MNRYYFYGVIIILWILLLDYIGVSKIYLGVDAIIMFLNFILSELVRLNSIIQKRDDENG